jgi:hypothetical protein
MGTMRGGGSTVSVDQVMMTVVNAASPHYAVRLMQMTTIDSLHV